MARYDGTTGDDTLTGTTANDIFYPLAGNDLVIGGGGFDTIVYGDTANNIRIGWNGTDLILQGADGIDHFRNGSAVELNGGTLDTTYMADIISDYERYAGRDPSGTEIRNWTIALNTGTGLEQMRENILLVSDYVEYMGRQPTASELTAGYALGAGLTEDAVRGTILASSEGRTYLINEVGSLYTTYLGRAATTGEIDSWRTALNTRTGHDTYGYDTTYDDIRDTLINSSQGRSYLTAAVQAIYQGLAGRSASAQEVDTWLAQFHLGLAPANVQTALANSTEVTAYITQRILSDWSEFVSLTPDSSTLAQHISQWKFWGSETSYENNFFFTGPNTAALTGLTVSKIYQSYTGHSANVTEAYNWISAYRAGSDTHDTRNALAALYPNGLAPVTTLTGTAFVDDFALSPTSGHVVVNGFNKTYDDVVLTNLPGFDPAAHVQVIANSADYIGSIFSSPYLATYTDLLITVDSHTSLLLTNTSSLDGVQFVHA